MTIIVKRPVSTLSPSRLARKRAHDRIAQRAARARTRSYIEQLERELTEFRNNPKKEVQELRHNNQVLQNEIASLQNAYESLIIEHSWFAATMPRGCFHNLLQPEHSYTPHTIHDNFTFDNWESSPGITLQAFPTNYAQVKVQPRHDRDIAGTGERGACLACDMCPPYRTKSISANPSTQHIIENPVICQISLQEGSYDSPQLPVKTK